MSRRMTRAPLDLVPNRNIRVWLGNGTTFSVMAQKVEIPGVERFVFYAYKGISTKYYAVVEGVTGLKVATALTAGELVQATITNIEVASGCDYKTSRQLPRFEFPLVEGINRHLSKHGITNEFPHDIIDAYKRRGVIFPIPIDVIHCRCTKLSKESK